MDLFGLVLCLLLFEFQVIITSKSTARFPTQLLYPRLISILLSLTLFHIILSLEPSPYPILDFLSQPKLQLELLSQSIRTRRKL
jgi:hypothetical protein